MTKLSENKRYKTIKTCQHIEYLCNDYLRLQWIAYTWQKTYFNFWNRNKKSGHVYKILKQSLKNSRFFYDFLLNFKRIQQTTELSFSNDERFLVLLCLRD